MGWQVTAWSQVLLAASLLSFGSAVYVFRHRASDDRPIVRPFLGFALAGGWWSLTYALQLSATTLSTKLFWLRAVWLGAAGVTIAWPLLVLVYTGRTAWSGRKRIALLSAVPAIVVVAAWSGGLTTFLYVDPTVESIGGIELLTFAPGPLLLSILAYSHVVYLLTDALLATIVVERTGPFRRQAAHLLLAGVAPSVAGIVGNAGLVAPQFVDLTPLAFALASPLAAWTLFGHRPIDVVPVPRETVFADLSIGVVVLSDGGTVVDANDVTRSLFGEDVVGASIDEAFEEYPVLIAAVARESGTVDARVTVETDEGATAIAVSTVPLEPDHARDVGTVVLLRDVTERKRLERRYQTLIEKAPNVIATVDGDWVIDYVSPSVDRLLGYDRTRVAGESILEFVHPEDRADLEDAIARSRGASEPVWATHRVRHADETWYEFETSVEPLFEGANEFVITATDVTEQRQYEQRLQVLNRILRHDINTQVNVIEGYVDLLEDHVAPAGEPYLTKICDEATQLANVGELAREIDVTLRADRDLRTVDLSRAVRRLATRVRDGRDAVTLVVDAPDGATASVDRLYRSALENVLENAIEHNDRANPTIEVGVTIDTEYVVVSIADDGPGIPAGQREVLESGEETPLEHANGLGLWLVNWIVTRSGGELDFEENDPRGSVVSLQFPRSDE